MNFIIVRLREEWDSFALSEKKIRLFLGDFRRFDLDARTRLYATERNLERCYFASDSLTSYFQGYVRNMQLPETASLSDHVMSASAAISRASWPLGQDYTGSFAGIVWNRRDRELSVCCDSIGFYPVYYLATDDALAVSSSVLALGALFDRGVDNIGLAERITGPEYSNFGRRTIVRGALRILPGELLRFRGSSSDVAFSLFDNTLFQGVCKESLEDAASRVWDVVKREVGTALHYEREVALGMSGGLDSRILLGAIGSAKSVRCLTYGEPDFYETQLAKRCALSRGAAFSCYPSKTSHFPTREKFLEYVISTEATGLQNWLAILEAQDQAGDGDLPMMLGDMCEAIPARNIKTYSSRKARMKIFLPLLAGQKLKFTPLTASRFAAWKESQFVRLESDLSALDLGLLDLTRAELVAAARSDLGELLDRVEAHHVEWVELLDELLAWYIHSRIPMGKQFLILKRRFFPISPMMSSGVLREVSRVRPEYRLNNFLMDKIFSSRPELSKLRKIPIAQVPYIGYGSNNYLKLFTWGLRAKIDQLLIARAVRRRDPKARSRVLKSIDWCEIYRQEGAGETVATWFEHDYTGRGAYVRDLVDRRSKLESWPLSTFDVASIASANLEISVLNEVRDS